jgi:TPR repeat protein
MDRRIIFGSFGILALAGALIVARLTSSPEASPATATTPKPPADVTSIRAKAEAGNAADQYRLGALYAGGEGVPQSYADAAQWYQKAAEQSLPEALLALGELHEAGQGVPLDPKRAVEFYQRAAEKGLAKAQYTLGFAYETGRGMPRDHQAAAKWFLKAAEQGEPLAQFDMGQRYVLGLGVTQDKVEGLKWLILAADQGQADAAVHRDKLKKELSRDQIREAESRAKGVTTAKLGR